MYVTGHESRGLLIAAFRNEQYSCYESFPRWASSRDVVSMQKGWDCTYSLQRYQVKSLLTLSRPTRT